LIKRHPHPPEKGLRDQGLGKLPLMGRQNFGPSHPPPKKRKGGFISGVAWKLYALQFRYLVSCHVYYDVVNVL
jgi:hypothetical protein